jgi:hypothetical protein
MKIKYGQTKANFWLSLGGVPSKWSRYPEEKTTTGKTKTHKR